jgi:hypothetical protein
MRRVAVLGALVLSLAGVAEDVAKPAPAGAAVPACDRVKVFRYDVTVTGMKSGRETFPADSAFEGEFSLSYDYVVRYPRVRVVVDRGCDPEIDTVRARGSGTGTLRNYAWADRSTRRDPADGTKVHCEFALAAGSLPTRLGIAGGTTVLGGGPSSFNVTSALSRSRQLAMLNQIDASRAAACDKGTFPNFRTADELALHRSVPIFENPVRAGNLRVEPPSIFLDGTLAGGGRRNPRALARLVAGRSARVATGVRTYEGTDDQSTATASTAVTIRFARRR